MIKISKMTIIGFLAVMTLFFTCSKKNGTKPEPAKYKWTILGYFDGNNSQDQKPDDHSFVIKDVQELEGIDSTEEVQIIVMLGSFKTAGNCKYYHIRRHQNEPEDSISSEVLADLGKKDMSDPTTLRDFISFGLQKYPAEHYMLIINDHGGGWKGVCSDNINGSGDWMTLSDLSFALYGFMFDILWLYTPSMASVEVAYQLKDRAKYMIASQFKWHPDNIMGATEPDSSSAWLPHLTKSPDIGARELGQRITQAIYNAAMSISPDKHVHSVLIYLPEIPTLATEISNLGRTLIDSTGSYWNEVWKAWEASRFLGFGDMDSDLVDLGEFADSIQKQPDLDATIVNRALLVENSINYTVSEQFVNPPYKRIHGLSIHLPLNEIDFDSTSYVQLDFPQQTEWDSFISVFIQSFFGYYSGALDIKSIPTGARVFINDVDTKDTTNAIITGLVPGDCVLKLTKSGYQDYIRSLTIYPQDTTIFVALLHKQ